VMGDPTLHPTSSDQYSHQLCISYPNATQSSRDMAFNPYHYRGAPSSGTESRVTRGTLQEVDRRSGTASGMARWLEEGQRSEAWNGIGFVRIRDDEYDERMREDRYEERESDEY
jgi:hypothetical protein